MTTTCPRCKGRGEISSHGFHRHCPRCAGTGHPWRSHGFDDDDPMLPADAPTELPTRAEWIAYAVVIVATVAFLVVRGWGTR